jgi:enterochelin esterase-like enzyme
MNRPQVAYFLSGPLVYFPSGVRSTGGNVLETSRHMRDVLLAKGYEVHYQQFVGGHDYLSWRGTLADGLIALIGRTGR